MNQIIYKIEGPDQNDRHLDLSVYEKKIGQLHTFLVAVAKSIGEDDAAFRVVNHPWSTPAAIVCEPLESNALPAAKVIDCIKENLNAVYVGRAVHISKLGSSARIDFAKYKISAEALLVIGDSGDAAAYKSGAEKPAARSFISAVDGRLEQVDIHGDAKQFKIYDLDYVIECNFPESLLEQVKNALGGHVEVYGLCSFLAGARFPYKVDVEKMRVFPPSDQLPSFEDIRGIMPALPGGKSSEEFVRELRNQWDEREKKLFGGR
ncbi:MAG: hypothetical protein OD918_05280 [Gammaproteobacteria bacterium]